MSDRELLELAAKAAGKTKARYVEIWDAMADPAEDGDVFDYRTYWSPLTDDDDALRLMVSLRLEPRFLDNSHSNGAEPSRVTLHNVAGIVENIDADPYAATRRAIVRAAAEIGRQMP